MSIRKQIPWLLAAVLAASSAHATDEADAVAVASKCAAEVNRIGTPAQVDCMDETALVDFKQLLLATLKRWPDNRDDFVKRLFGESASFDEVVALAPADFMKRMLQRQQATVQKHKIGTRIEVIGAVKDGERVHVLTRERSGAFKPSGSEVATTEVSTYIKRNGQWRSELRGDAKQLELMIRKLGG